jgi:hypothetical protein
MRLRHCSVLRRSKIEIALQNRYARSERACDMFEIFRHCGYGSRKMMMIRMVVGKKKCLSEKSLAV